MNPIDEWLDHLEVEMQKLREELVVIQAEIVIMGAELGVESD